MAVRKPDFSGWATKANLRCTDGRVISDAAFEHQDKIKVPLMWSHQHSDIEHVLGHVELQHRKGEGVYCDGFLNDSPKAVHTKAALKNGDLDSLSIWANELMEKMVNGAKQVLHGSIKEVSLVLSGANP